MIDMIDLSLKYYFSKHFYDRPAIDMIDILLKEVIKS